MTRRYLTATATERSAGLAVVAVIGVAFIALIVYLHLDTRGAPPEVLLLTAPGLALLGGAAYFWLSKRDWVTVDFEKRTATFVGSANQAGRSVSTGQVVEVVSADAICICTPRSALAIPQGFCDPPSTARVIDELRRVIGEKGRPT